MMYKKLPTYPRRRRRQKKKKRGDKVNSKNSAGLQDMGFKKARSRLDQMQPMPAKIAFGNCWNGQEMARRSCFDRSMPNMASNNATGADYQFEVV